MCALICLPPSPNKFAHVLRFQYLRNMQFYAISVLHFGGSKLMWYLILWCVGVQRDFGWDLLIHSLCISSIYNRKTQISNHRKWIMRDIRWKQFVLSIIFEFRYTRAEHAKCKREYFIFNVRGFFYCASLKFDLRSDDTCRCALCSMFTVALWVCVDVLLLCMACHFARHTHTITMHKSSSHGFYIFINTPAFLFSD